MFGKKNYYLKKEHGFFSQLILWFVELRAFGTFVRAYLKYRIYKVFAWFENFKDKLADMLYMQRGKYTKPFLHFGTIGLSFLMVTLGPNLLNKTDRADQQRVLASPVLSTATAAAPDFYTSQAEEVRQYRGGEIITHVVTEEIGRAHV